MKVLGIREARRTHSWANLDHGRTSQQVREWGAGPLAGQALVTSALQGTLPGIPSWLWLQHRTCHPRALRLQVIRTNPQIHRIGSHPAAHPPAAPNFCYLRPWNSCKVCGLEREEGMAKCGLRVTCFRVHL